MVKLFKLQKCELSKKNKIDIICTYIVGIIILLFNITRIISNINTKDYIDLIFNIIILILGIFILIKYFFAIVQKEEHIQKIDNLELHNKTLLTMYDSIRGFRHDFANFLQSLNGYVINNNIEGIRIMCNSIIKDCNSVNNMGVLQPEVINNPAIYSIVTNKYYMAKEKGININIEVMVDLKELEKYNYEICRILAILLDNAIDAAEKCNEKIINLSFIKDNKVPRKVIVVENSYNNKDIDVDKIYEKGYTSKMDGTDLHGLGLWNVRRILKQSNNLNLFTTKGELFSQRLEIY